MSTETPEVSVLVVSYNTRDLTLACLRSLEQEARDVAYELLVIDNASADGSAAAIAEAFPSATVIANDANVGFGQANNLLEPRARGQYLLLLNPDTVVLEGAVQNLLAFARTCPDAGVWGGRTLFSDGSLDPTSCWRRISLWSTFCHAAGLSALFRRSALFDPETYGPWERDTERDVDIVTGCFLLIRTSLFRELEGFDKRFFMYAEEADLCLRAGAAGHRPRVTPNATIIHHGGASERVHADKQVRQLKARNQLNAKHMTRTKSWLAERLTLVGVGWRTLAFSLAGLVLPSKRESASTWREVWSRRREWASPG